MRVLNTIKTFTMVATLLAGGTTLAMAQNGLPTGDETPVAGGANAPRRETDDAVVPALGRGLLRKNKLDEIACRQWSSFVRLGERDKSSILPA